jgi:hypothetical protein
MDAVSYPVALNAILMKKKQKAAKKNRPTIRAKIQNDRLKSWNEIASFLGQSVAVAKMRKIRHARDSGRQVHVCLSGEIERIPRPRSWSGRACSHRDRKHGSVC